MTGLPATTQLLELNTISLHVEDTGGTGRPIVLIHGWPLSGASWKLQIPALQNAGFRVISYDRRGFGESDKPKTGYDYDTLTEDLHELIEAMDLKDVSLIGFSMGGGEVARYVSTYGESRLHSLVFASSVPPMLMKTPENPEGPLEKEKATTMTDSLTQNADAFYDQFTKEFFSPNGNGAVMIPEIQRQEALELCKLADKDAALQAMSAFGTTDFRNDLPHITIPTLVIHGDADGIVPFEGSGKRTNEAISQSELHVVKGGPHGINVSHTEEFNEALIEFLKK